MEFSEGRDIVEAGIGPGIGDHDEAVPHQHSAAIGHPRSPNSANSREITSQFYRGLQPQSMWLGARSFRGARLRANPEGRPSGSGPSDHLGMTVAHDWLWLCPC